MPFLRLRVMVRGEMECSRVTLLCSGAFSATVSHGMVKNAILSVRTVGGPVKVTKRL